MKGRNVRIWLLIFMVTVSLACLSACNKHEHSYVDGWFYDETHHWRIATCDDLEGNKGFYDLHNFVDGVCTLCKYEDPNYVKPGADEEEPDEEQKDTEEPKEEPQPPEDEGSADRPKPPEEEPGSPSEDEPSEDEPTDDDYDAYYLPENDYTWGEGTISDGLNFTELFKEDALVGYAVSIAYDNRNIRELIVPQTFNGLPVLMVDNSGFKDLEILEKVTLPEGMLFLGEDAFRSCDALWNVTIPSSVKIIGKNAFYGCAYLTQLTLSEGLLEIRYGAFYKCGFDKLTIPNSVRTIASQAFYECKLKELNFGSGVTYVGGQAFCNCGISRVNITDLKAWCNITFVWDNSNPLYPGGSLYLDGQPIKKLEIPEGCGVKKYSFSGFASLEEVTIPSSAGIIGDNAFMRCSSLSKVTFKEGAYEIGSYVFGYCYKLKELVLPDSIKTIRINAVYNCSNLSKIVLGKGISLIEMDAITQISNSAQIYYRGSEAEWKKVVKGSSWAPSGSQIQYNYKDE